MSPGLSKIPWKGLETLRLIGLTGVGFDNARENSKASVTPVNIEERLYQGNILHGELGP